MVYCTECGTKNEESAKTCEKCGAKLNVPKKSLEEQIENGAEEFGKRAEKWGKSFGKSTEDDCFGGDECFGLPNGGTIFGIIIGIIIVLVGISSLLGIDLEFWPLIIIIFGVLILGGAIYSLTKKR